MRIVTLLVRHGTEKYADAVEHVQALFARQMPRVDWDLVVVDNSLPQGHEKRLGANCVLIGAANAQWEFSAWDDGIAYVGKRLASYDLVHLATSAFRTLYTKYLDRICEDMLRLVARRGAAVGHIDYYNDAVGLFGRQSQAWLRSSFLFLPPAELTMLGSLVSVTDQKALFTGDPANPFGEDAPISQNYRHYVTDWLTGEGTGQGVQWHSSFGLSYKTLDWFQNKTLAILNEHMLSIRLRAQGCAMVDVTWLAGQAKSGQPIRRLPPWQKQITARDTDPAPTSLLAREATVA